MKKEKEAWRLLRKGNFGEAVDKFNEAGREYQRLGETEKAIEVLKEGSKLAAEHRKLFEGCLCERSMSEIYAENGEREPYLQHIAAFRRLALESGSRSQEQLSYHVEAWCLQQLYLNGVVETTEIEIAIKQLKKSMELLELYKKLFKESDPGGPPHSRKVQLLTLEAQLQSQLGNNDEALQILEKTSKMLKPNDKALRFEILRTKCSIAPVERRIDIAQLMDDEAPEDRKAQTLCELSHQYVLGNQLNRGYKSLATAYMLYEKHLSTPELDDTVKRLCILYRLVQYSKILKNPKREPKITICELHEAVGDMYDKYFQTLMPKEKKEYKRFIRENILKNYEKMLEFKRNDNDGLRAYQAMALVYGDLDDFEKSKTFFEKRLLVLKQTGATQEKILDARVSIFGCMCKLNSFDLEKMFEELNDEVVQQDTKRELYDIWANYWLDRKNEENAKKWGELVDSIPYQILRNDDDETDILFWRLSDEHIIEKCKEENEVLKLDNLSEYKKTKTNEKGETILHQAAMKSDNEAVVERLCRVKCDVNALDNGGWTPLSEAVAHNQLGNAHVLIRYGANVNVRSQQSYIDEDSQSSSDNSSHYGLTPLMDACSNGFIDIAKLLIENKARVDYRDSSKWTAYEHLKHFISDTTADEETMKFADYLKNLTANCAQFIDYVPLKKRNTLSRPQLDDCPPDEEEDRMILNIAASRKRQNTGNSETFGNIPKRKQMSGENTRQSTSPTNIIRATNKRTVQPSITLFAQAKRLHRQTSSSSLNSRKSLSPRHSISPTTTVRSAPSEYRRDDDLQVLKVRRSNGQVEVSPSSRIVQSVVSQRQIPPSKLQMSHNNSSEIVVKCCFENFSGNVPDDIRPVKLPMKRSMSIAEVKVCVISNNSSLSQLIIKEVWDKEDKEKAEIGDTMLLSHITEPNQRELALVFQLSAPPAHIVYQENLKNPITEVTNQLKLLSTDKILDLSTLLLDSREISEMTNTFKKCDRPRNSRINLSFCELSIEDESNLQCLLDECSELLLSNTLSKTGFSGIFEKTKNRMEKLEILGIDFRDESQIIKILKNCPNLRVLRLSSVRMSSSVSTLSDSMIPPAINALKSLVRLDLSFNSSWISEQSWRQMLKGLQNLEELIINETRNELQFESDWLPNLSSFSARGSDLQWDSVFELFSVLEKISFVDVRYSTVDPSLSQELKNSKPMIELLF